MISQLGYWLNANRQGWDSCFRRIPVRCQKFHFTWDFRGNSTGFTRYFSAVVVVIKALLNSRRGNHVWLVKIFFFFFRQAPKGSFRNFPRETEPTTGSCSYCSIGKYRCTVPIDQRSLMSYVATTKKCLPRIFVRQSHHRHKKPLRACSDTLSRHWHQTCPDTFSRHWNQLRWSWRGGARAAAVTK